MTDRFPAGFRSRANRKQAPANRGQPEQLLEMGRFAAESQTLPEPLQNQLLADDIGLRAEGRQRVLFVNASATSSRMSRPRK